MSNRTFFEVAYRTTRQGRCPGPVGPDRPGAASDPASRTASARRTTCSCTRTSRPADTASPSRRRDRCTPCARRCCRAPPCRCASDTGSCGLIPVHQGSHAEAPGCIQETSARRLGVAKVAIESVLASAAAVRPNINTRQGLTRGTVDDEAVAVDATIERGFHRGGARAGQRQAGPVDEVGLGDRHVPGGRLHQQGKFSETGGPPGHVGSPRGSFRGTAPRRSWTRRPPSSGGRRRSETPSARPSIRSLPARTLSAGHNGRPRRRRRREPPARSCGPVVRALSAAPEALASCRVPGAGSNRFSQEPSCEVVVDLVMTAAGPSLVPPWKARPSGDSTTSGWPPASTR